MDLNPNIEYIIHCEENGQTLGPISRKHAHIPEVRKSLCDKAIVAMLYCKSTKKWGIQKKFSKAINREIWDCSVGGHCVYSELVDPKYNNEFEETLTKEFYEELGLNIKISNKFENETGYIFKNYLYKNHFNNEYLGIGIIFTNDETISPVNGEVFDFNWLSLDELENLLQKDGVSDTLKTVFPFVKEEFEVSIQKKIE